MAVNSYNPRLVYGLSSSSSENDVEDVFCKPGVAPSTVQADKNRASSDPVYTIAGKDSLKDIKGLVTRTLALSDSSNVLKRQGTQPSLAGKPSVDNKKFTEIALISEESEFRSTSLVGNHSFVSSEKSDNTFPQPESLRDRTRDSNDAMIEEEFSRDGFINTFDFLDEGHDVLLQNSVSFEDIVVQAGEGVAAEDDDDENYPEIERYPSGYGSMLYDDIRLASDFTPDTTRIVMPSYDSESFPDIPKELMSSFNSSYVEEYSFDLSPAEMFEIPLTSMQKLSTGDW